MDIMTAVREVLKNALHHEGLQRGLRLAVKALDRNVAQFCFLAEDCDESSYTRLIEVSFASICVMCRPSARSARSL